MADNTKPVYYNAATDEFLMSDGSHVSRAAYVLGKLEVRQEVWRDDQWHRDGVKLTKVYR